MPQADCEYIIATHSLVYGAPQALCDYLNNSKTESFFFISHSLIADGKSPSQLIHYNQQKPTTLASRLIRSKNQLLKTCAEMMLNFTWVMNLLPQHSAGGRCKIFIGVNPINALCGLLLKKNGYVDRVIFYTIDYVPKRHPNALINFVYHKIDQYCYMNADSVWNVSARINEGRLSNGYKSVKRANVEIVPIGVWPAPDPTETPRKQNQVVFIGHLLEKQGVQYVLAALPLLIKNIPDLTFVVIGGGEYEEALKAESTRLGLDKYVTFTGWVKDRAQAEALLKQGELAVAPYDKELDTFTYYADPTKLKDYLQCGLPIILTDVPHNAKEIENQQCGVVVTLEPASIAGAISAVLLDRTRLAHMREQTKHYIAQFSWDNIFADAIRNLN